MSKRPTKRALVFVGAGGLLVVVGSTAQAGYLFVLAAVVLGVVAWSPFARSRLGQYEVTRKLPARVAVGDEVDVRFTLRNGSEKRVAPGARVVDVLPAYAPTPLACDGLSPLETARVRIGRTAVCRGVYSDGDVVLTSGWPFGLTRSTRRVRVASPVTVVPKVVELAGFPLIDSTSTVSNSDRLAAHSGAGEQFLGVRDYRSGDDARHIHWRSSGRRGDLVVREYEDEASDGVALLVAGADHGRPPDSSFEALISAAASVALYALRQELMVHLARPRSDGGVDRLVSSHPREVLDWLASAGAIDASLMPLVAASFGSGRRPGAAVLFSPSAGRAGAEIPKALAAIRRHGIGAVSVIADSGSWARDSSSPVPVLPDPTRILAQGRELAQCLQA